MSTEPGSADDEDAEPYCRLHPLGCPRFQCRECHKPTTNRTGTCYDCLAERNRLEAERVPGSHCSVCGEVAELVVTLKPNGQSLCRSCASTGRS